MKIITRIFDAIEGIGDKPWPCCTGCGVCCQDVGHVKDLTDRGYVLPSGLCKHYLVASKSCAIYSTRPDVCRVMKVRPPLVSEETWSLLNVQACDQLHLREFGVPREDKGQCQHRRK